MSQTDDKHGSMDMFFGAAAKMEHRVLENGRIQARVKGTKNWYNTDKFQHPHNPERRPSNASVRSTRSTRSTKSKQSTTSTTSKQSKQSKQSHGGDHRQQGNNDLEEFYKVSIITMINDIMSTNGAKKEIRLLYPRGFGPTAYKFAQKVVKFCSIQSVAIPANPHAIIWGDNKIDQIAPDGSTQWVNDPNNANFTGACSLQGGNITIEVKREPKTEPLRAETLGVSMGSVQYSTYTITGVLTGP